MTLKLVQDLGTRGNHYQRYWLVECRCGRRFEARADGVKSGHVKSCIAVSGSCSFAPHVQPRAKPAYDRRARAWRISLTRGAFALVDSRDFKRVAAFNWSLFARKDRPSYAVRSWRRGMHKHITLHQLILRTTAQIDHANGDGLDCRRKNLRLASNTQQRGNQLVRRDSGVGFKGVQHSPRGALSFVANITASGRKKFLGTFSSGEAAARAYDAAARRVFGVFACVNFPKRGERPARRGGSMLHPEVKP